MVNIDMMEGSMGLTYLSNENFFGSNQFAFVSWKKYKTRTKTTCQLLWRYPCITTVTLKTLQL